ncbi:uncharacterized protein [Halyomorpha halys]|uniref:uncharacterized protein isoform X3 n=1 Tax=Halyomorpha halys TaxID=286706 RepID=UPI0006D4F54A|nr:uncharacterized protein LOC106691818 isoform X7 [Halyomorpha halys]
MSTWLLYLRIKLAKPYLSLLSSEIPVLKEMTDKTEFSCGLTFIKQELIIPDEVSTIVTKEDEKPNIDSAGGLVHAKEEKDDLDEGGLIHVRQEIIYLPDESSSNWNVSIKKEMTFDTESNGGITEVKQEVYVKHEELLISDEDGSERQGEKVLKNGCATPLGQRLGRNFWLQRFKSCSLNSTFKRFKGRFGFCGG